MAKKRKSYYTKSEATANGISFAAKEAYNLLRTNLFFSFSDDAKCHVIGVTSTIPSEGKSLTAANTAMAMAEAGKRVLLIDCDCLRSLDVLTGVTEKLVYKFGDVIFS